MSIHFLKVSDIRNLRKISLSLSPRVNLFYGDNGSGKTSLLEAVHILALAKSFRTNKLKPLITKGSRACTVYGEVDCSTKVGVKRGLDSLQSIKINGFLGRSIADLANLLPIQLMTPDTFNYLLTSASYRRKIIDWGAFHHEKKFIDVWKKMTISLKNRNSLLKNRVAINSKEMDVWTKIFIDSAQIVDKARLTYLQQLIPEIEVLLLKLTSISGLKINYYRGWSRNSSLEDVLTQNTNKDSMLGYTILGPQRGDLRITCHGLPATEVLSRGQQKMVVCAIKLAQGLLFENTKNRTCVYLVDDLISELDSTHCHLFAKVLKEMNSQVWITGVNGVALKNIFNDKNVKMFHVEHGEVSEIVDVEKKIVCEKIL